MDEGRTGDERLEVRKNIKGYLSNLQHPTSNLQIFPSFSERRKYNLIIEYNFKDVKWENRELVK